MTMPSTRIATSAPSSGGRLVASDGRELPLRATRIASEARGGVARTTLAQTFTNSYAEPLEVRYQVPLPHEGAVSGFAFELESTRIVGKVDRKADARAAFERAIVEGKTAALLDQERGSLFTQEVGNIPPGATVVCELSVDQRLAWIDELGGWEWRFPTVVAPRYLGEHTADAARVAVDVADGPLAVRAELALAIRDGDGRPESPSHELAVARRPGGAEIGFAAEGARLDRDVVVRWRAASGSIATALAVARPAEGHARAKSAFGLVTVLPPAGEAPAVPRDLVLLIDASGSMYGEPLGQARRVALALVDSLGPEDSFDLLAFASEPTRCSAEPLRATAAAKKKARAWLDALQAGGSTEMHKAIIAALQPLRGDAQRQVVLVSDGLIGFESQVVREVIERLPRGSRVHTVGVGSGVNRSLTAPAARAGHGLEVIIACGEDPERAAERILARTAAPLVVDFSVSGSALRAGPERPVDLFAGAPALVPVELDPEGGELVLGGRTAKGEWRERIAVPACKPGEGAAALAALFAREAVEDLEMRHAVGERVDEAIERLGLDFQIATRVTSWIAVSDRATVDPRSPTRAETMPHELPASMSVARLGLRPAAPPAMYAASLAMPGAMPMAPAPAGGFGPPPPPQARASMPMEPADDDDDPITRATAAAPAQAKAKASEGFLGRVRRMFQKDSGELTVDGKLTESGGLAIVSFQIPSDFAWDPQKVEAALPSGDTVELVIAEAATTRSGELRAGQLARLALDLGSVSAGDLLELVVHSGGATLRIRLRR